jgi:hypothetical protein
MPPAYSSGRASIFREPHAEHIICLATSGMGVSGGIGTVARVDIALVTAGDAVNPQQLIVVHEVSKCGDRRMPLLWVVQRADRDLATAASSSSSQYPGA